MVAPRTLSHAVNDYCSLNQCSTRYLAGLAGIGKTTLYRLIGSLSPDGPSFSKLCIVLELKPERIYPNPDLENYTKLNDYYKELLHTRDNFRASYYVGQAAVLLQLDLEFAGFGSKLIRDTESDRPIAPYSIHMMDNNLSKTSIDIEGYRGEADHGIIATIMPSEEIKDKNGNPLIPQTNVFNSSLLTMTINNLKTLCLKHRQA